MHFLIDITFAGACPPESCLHVSGVAYRFKVHGENRFVAMVNGLGPAEGILQKLRDVPTISVSCIPLITMYQFVCNSVGLKEEDWREGNDQCQYDPSKETFFTHFTMGYSGHTQEEYKKIWHDQAVKFLKLQHGTYAMKMFKNVGTKEFYMIAQMTGGQLDEMVFDFPIEKAMGGEIKAVTKSVAFI